MSIPKTVATVGKEPAVKAQPATPIVVQDAYGRNTTKWTTEVEGRPEGPLSVMVALPLRNAREYLTREEAIALVDQVLAAVDAYDIQVAASPA
jgi:hypothetical protein